MSEFPGFSRGVSVNRIVTKRFVQELVRDSDSIHIIRSAVFGTLGHCVEEIEQACRASTGRKLIRIVLPSIFNEDLVVRAREAGLVPQDIRTRLGQWHEAYAALAKRIEQHHTLELRTTVEPHRYHAMFSELRGIVGVPWHTKASLSTSSFFIGPEASSVMSNLHEDFEKFFEKSTPYAAGDNRRNIIKKEPAVIDDPVLQEFGKLLPWIIGALRYIASAFPDANGEGVTKDHLHEKFHIDKSDCNKRLVDMEEAGLLRRAGTLQDRRHGRLVTSYGRYALERFKDRGIQPSL